MLAGKNPLVGHNDAELGPRYPPASNAFDPKLQDDVLKSAMKLDMCSFVRENGTYCFVSGPMYESKAECKFLRTIGGDCVGMSTVPEIVAAHHSGLKVICLSLITNKVVVSGDEGPPASHEEVLEAVPTRSVQIQGLVKDIVKSLNEDGVLDAMPDLACIDLEAYSVDRVKKLGKMCSCPYALVTGIPRYLSTVCTEVGSFVRF
jgi:purine-nucleoside phosphorylase